MSLVMSQYTSSTHKINFISKHQCTIGNLKFLKYHSDRLKTWNIGV